MSTDRYGMNGKNLCRRRTATAWQRMILCSTALSLAAVGCSPTPSDDTAAGITRPVGIAPAPCQLTTSGSDTIATCSVERVDNGVTYSWTETSVSSPEPISTIGPKQRISSVTTTITANNQTVVQMVRRTSPTTGGNSEEIADFTYGPAVTGIHAARLVNNAGTISGIVDGRNIIPLKVTAGVTAADIKYADGKPGPVGYIAAAMTTSLNLLLQQAVLIKAQPVVKLQPVVKFKPADTVEGGSVYPDDGSNATAQNDLSAPATPHCEQCVGDCGKNVENWLVPGMFWVCEGECFIPGNGCAEQICPIQYGIGSCDGDQECCGGAGCCGYDRVCGSQSLGACCPKDHPVACGNQTAVFCFAPGSSCCGDSISACKAGETCLNFSGSWPNPYCCPNNKVCGSGSGGTCCGGNETCQQGSSGKSLCCDRPLCGDECCASGQTCSNGHCSYGGSCGPSGVDCGFLPCCNGACCNGTCLNGNLCCPSSQATCGTACCGADEVCLNAATSTCGKPLQPTLQLVDPSTGVIIGQTGGLPARLTNSSNVIVKGHSFAAGTVTLSVDKIGGTVITTVTADASGNFSTEIGGAVFGGGNHKLVAAEGSLSTSADVNVQWIF